MKKILLILQHCEHDKKQAIALARLIADLEGHTSDIADFMFCAAYGSDHDWPTVEYVKKKFNVRTMRCINPASGWPHGPNSQMHETITEVFIGHRDKQWDYAAFLLMEPDCVPLAKDWVRQLYDEWHQGQQQVLGPWLDRYNCDCGDLHINGNLMMAPAFLRENKNFRYPAMNAWDTWFAGIILPKARASRLIWSDYRLDTPSKPLPDCEYLFAPKQYRGDEHPLKGETLQPVWLHGIKSMRGIECARARLLPQLIPV